MRLNSLYIVISNVLFLGIIFLVAQSELVESQQSGKSGIAHANNANSKKPRVQPVPKPGHQTVSAKHTAAKTSISSASATPTQAQERRDKRATTKRTPSNSATSTETHPHHDPTPPPEASPTKTAPAAMPSYTKLPPCCPVKRTRIQRMRDWVDAELQRLEADLTDARERKGKVSAEPVKRKTIEKRVPYPVCKFVCPEGMWIGRKGDRRACRCP
jgi:hypothetical protein